MFLLARETHNNSVAGIRSHFEYDHDGVSSATICLAFSRLEHSLTGRCGLQWAAWPRWSDDDTSWDEVKDLYGKVAAAGEPLGGYVESAGMVFTRKFERLTVQVDCTNRLSNYTWA